MLDEAITIPTQVVEQVKYHWTLFGSILMPNFFKNLST